MSNINVNEMVERFGRGFLFTNKQGYLFYCYDSDRSYYRIDYDDSYKGYDTDNWVEFVRTNTFMTTFQFIDKDGNQTNEPVYYE